MWPCTAGLGGCVHVQMKHTLGLMQPKRMQHTPQQQSLMETSAGSGPASRSGSPIKPGSGMAHGSMHSYSIPACTVACIVEDALLCLPEQIYRRPMAGTRDLCHARKMLPPWHAAMRGCPGRKLLSDLAAAIRVGNPAGRRARLIRDEACPGIR